MRGVAAVAATLVALSFARAATTVTRDVRPTVGELQQQQQQQQQEAPVPNGGVPNNVKNEAPALPPQKHSQDAADKGLEQKLDAVEQKKPAQQTPAEQTPDAVDQVGKHEAAKSNQKPDEMVLKANQEPAQPAATAAPKMVTASVDQGPAPAAAAAAAPAAIVVWSAPHLTTSGYGQEARSFDMALKGRIDGLVAIQLTGDFMRTSVDKSLMSDLDELQRKAVEGLMEPGKSLSDDQIRNSILICHSIPLGWQNKQCAGREGRYMVGRSMFETDGVPSGWLQNMKAMDELWVPSHWNADTFARAGVDRGSIHVVPEPVDTEQEFNPALVKTKYSLPTPTTRDSKIHVLSMLQTAAADDTKAAATALNAVTSGDDKVVKFLSVFKWHKRKGPEVLLQAFCEEFHGSDDAVLYIKANGIKGAANPREEVNKLLDDCQQKHHIPDHHMPQVVLIDHWIPQSALPSLYSAADAFVLPSRGEGWGLPMAEAMAMALPTIATGWSGTSEFLKEGVALPVRSSLVKLSDADAEDMFEGGAKMLKGHSYAEPDVLHLRERMRWVVTNRDQARELGLRGRAHMRDNFSSAAVAGMVSARLAAIRQTTKWGAAAAVSLVQAAEQPPPVDALTP